MKGEPETAHANSGAFAPRLANPASDRPGRSDCAFGVDPFRRQYYSLRQSRYDALAQDINDWAGAASGREKPRLLIVGCGAGSELRHLESKRYFTKLAVSGADLNDMEVYGRGTYEEFFIGDLTQGYPDIASKTYDFVVCEQVLEHLDEVDIAITTLGRVLKPGGRAIVGVPIFPPPLHLIRRHVVPKLDALLARRRSRGHRQAFCLSSFLEAMGTHSGLRLVKVRGFRVVSGGLLKGLENYRWWWRLNRRLGEFVPGVCIEVQAVLEKPLQQTTAETGDRNRALRTLNVAAKGLAWTLVSAIGLCVVLGPPIFMIWDAASRRQDWRWAIAASIGAIGWLYASILAYASVAESVSTTLDRRFPEE